MRIAVNRIPPEGISLAEEISSSALDLNIEAVKFQQPIKVRADIRKIASIVIADISLDTAMSIDCSRCLNEFEVPLRKDVKLSYQVDSLEQVINLDEDIREELILEYPLKPLCKADCKGLCYRCGKNLNEGGCSCGST